MAREIAGWPAELVPFVLEDADANYTIADVFVDGNIVYAACLGYGVATYDISDPTDLILLDSMWVLEPSFATRMKYQNAPSPEQYIPHYIDYLESLDDLIPVSKLEKEFETYDDDVMDVGDALVPAPEPEK